MRSKPIPKIEESIPFWINEQKAAEITGIALQTLRNMRCKGVGLPIYKVGRSVRYRLDDVLAFMEKRRVEPRD